MGVRAGKFAPFLFLGPPRAVYLSPPRCLTCSLGLARCSMGRGISRGARKLARTPTLSKKKKKLGPPGCVAQWLRGAALLSSNSGLCPSGSGAGEFVPFLSLLGPPVRYACHPRGALHAHWACKMFSGPWD